MKSKKPVRMSFLARSTSSQKKRGLHTTGEYDKGGLAERRQGGGGKVSEVAF
tara:strand:- start:11 stop:166 length:156 start_codon:yes stop_codon:yes gene_type:complete